MMHRGGPVELAPGSDLKHFPLDHQIPLRKQSFVVRLDAFVIVSSVSNYSLTGSTLLKR